MNPVRIVIFSNLNFFAHILLGPSVEDEGIEVVGLVEVQGDYSGQRGLRILRAHYQRSGLRFTATKVGWSLLGQVALRRPGYRGIVQRLRQAGHPTLTVDAVGEPPVEGLLRDVRPDIVLSVNCPQRIDESLLAHARVGGVNVHASLLPMYAGLAPYVWVLSEGLAETGITVHEMRQEFDAGRILWQHREPIPAGISAFQLYRRLAVKAGLAIPDVLGRVATEGFDWGAEQDIRLRSYRSLPSREAISALRSHNHPLTKPSDVTALLRKDERAH